ncbi:2-oxoglutarate dehydrogenase E1 component [candidate division CSSED10-310 bacterium]|uniref:oxoglutarate dehydrogenase (succinyl-transferring) n=1 Tax=candidate division CSSED10-310 bacterium TaxID=2855610 RepID=A0ABV6Z1I5_UNCC1
MDNHDFASMPNAAYIEQLYGDWKSDNSSVDRQWHYFFTGFEMGLSSAPGGDEETVALIDKQARVDSLIYAYRDVGYLSANLDPLEQQLVCHHELMPDEFNLTPEDLERKFSSGHFPGQENPTLKEIIQACNETYCRTIGVEYLHIQDKTIRRWLQNRMEPQRNKPALSEDKKILILKKLLEAEIFERFLHTHYTGQKRFSLEGAETVIPALHALVERGPEVGIEELVIGMSHRGRLNVLANIIDKSIAEIFSEFEDNFIPETYGGDGDVKYHKGYSTNHMNYTGKFCHLSLAANPSHLEIISPVIQGKVRAKQRQLKDTEDRKRVLPVLLHGDAAFSGQGVVAETLNLSQLRGYKTGGTIHIIVNNQIGFTTSPREARSSCFPTDIAKMLSIPIFHVNADDPEAVIYLSELALDFRQTFKRDVVIDIFCYRRHGHNEWDEPSFTQPRQYELIKAHPGTRHIYNQKLIDEEVVTEKFVTTMETEIQDYFQRAFQLVKTEALEPTMKHHTGLWAGFGNVYSHEPVETGIAREDLTLIAQKVSAIPADFNIHPKLKNITERRLKRFETQGQIDWSFAEALAFGSLLLEKIPIRLSGQDSGRGTFSQRHAIMWDTVSETAYLALNHISEEQEYIYVYNSPLSEASVLGFEYGYTVAEPKMLIMWEAQFGDFTNGAQVIIDQFLASSESKWQRSSGLVMLLPHGYEGQGPEHSSAHFERFLQLCAEDNMQVCNATTPAQYFHVLRRQMQRNFRKPLIIMTPKSLLRHPLVISPLEDFVSGSFSEVLDDHSIPEKKTVVTILLCTGKIYYDLWQRRKELKRHSAALIRIEQLYPFPHQQLQEVAALYQDVKRILWVQEESQNRGAWTYINPRLQEIFGQNEIVYCGRDASASPATGSLRQHNLEQKMILKQAFGE